MSHSAVLPMTCTISWFFCLLYSDKHGVTVFIEKQQYSLARDSLARAAGKQLICISRNFSISSRPGIQVLFARPTFRTENQTASIICKSEQLVAS